MYVEELKKKMKQQRDIKDVTADSYTKTVMRLYSAVKAPAEPEMIQDLDWLNRTEEVLKEIKQMSSNIGTQKNYICAVIVALSTSDENKRVEDAYQVELNVLREKLDDFYADGKKTQKQKDNMVSWAHIIGLREAIRKRVNTLLRMKGTDLSPRDLMEYQQFVAICLYTYLRPSRNDYHDTLMLTKREYDQLSDKDKDENNYMVFKNKSNAFYHRADYKTRKTHGIEIAEIPKSLVRILQKWRDLSKQKFLLMNKSGSVMKSHQLTRFLTDLFLKHIGKRISSTLLRQIYLTDKYSKAVKELHDDTKKMNNSIRVALRHYIKQD